MEHPVSGSATYPRLAFFHRVGLPAEAFYDRGAPSTDSRRRVWRGHAGIPVWLALGIRGAAECRNRMKLAEIIRSPSAAALGLVGRVHAPVIDLLGLLRHKFRVGAPDASHPPMLPIASYRCHMVVEVGPEHMVIV